MVAVAVIFGVKPLLPEEGEAVVVVVFGAKEPAGAVREAALAKGLGLGAEDAAGAAAAVVPPARLSSRCFLRRASFFCQSSMASE